VRINPTADGLGMFAFEKMGSAAGELHYLDAPLNGPHGIEKHRAVLFCDDRCQLSLVLLQGTVDLKLTAVRSNAEGATVSRTARSRSARTLASINPPTLFSRNREFVARA
jgi:hypothetical protein